MTNKDMKPIDPTQVTILGKEAFEDFQAKVNAPGQVSPGLQKAFERHKKIFSQEDDES